MVHRLDHLVLPVSDLAQMRKRLAALGFTIAAEGQHPFGTVNACVFLRDGTYLEPLAIRDAAVYREASRSGNSFIRRDETYRSDAGREGFSALVYATSDARADHEAYRQAGFEAGDLVEFSRPFLLPDGSQATGAFRLAFAADPQAQDFFAFSCQRLVAFPSDRQGLEDHANAVVSLKTVLLSAAQPEDYEEFLVVSSADAQAQKVQEGLAVDLPNARVLVLDAKAAALWGFGSSNVKTGLQGVGIVFGSRNLAVTESCLADNGIAYSRNNHRLLVKPAPGQGAMMVFEESL